MSASPTDMQGLISQLQSAGILSDLSGGSDQGLLGKALAPYGGATNVGLNLLANSGPSPYRRGLGQVIGQSALQAQQIAQQSQTSALQRQLMQMEIAQGAVGLGNSVYTLGLRQKLAAAQGAGQNAPQAPSVGAAAAPQDTPASAAQATPAPQASVSAPSPAVGPISDDSLKTATALALSNPSANPLEVLGQSQKIQVEQAQRAAAPKLAVFDNVVKSDSPTRDVRANPQLLQLWAQTAPSYGIDPVKGFNDQTLRTVFGMAGNQVRAQVGLPTQAPPLPLQNDGIVQKDPLTGKVEHEEELQQIVGPNGQPMLVPRSQAVGKQPFNASIFGASNLSNDAVQLAADTYRTTGKMPAAFGRNPAMQAKVLDRVAQDAKAAGDTAGAIAARSASLKANGMALDQVTKLESATTSYAATLDKNLESLLAAAKKVDSTGSPLLNRAVRAWQQGITGDKDTAQMVTWLNAVEGEYAKINSGSLGNAPTSDAAKRDAKDVINKYMSAGGMEAVAQAMRAETKNRLSSIAEQKQSLGTQLSAGPPRSSGPPAMTNARGWVLHTDKLGRQAYVSPDGKQFEVVK